MEVVNCESVKFYSTGPQRPSFCEENRPERQRHRQNKKTNSLFDEIKKITHGQRMIDETKNGLNLQL